MQIGAGSVRVRRLRELRAAVGAIIAFYGQWLSVVIVAGRGLGLLGARSVDVRQGRGTVVRLVL